MARCNLCPRRCDADRSTAAGRRRALCRAGELVELARAGFHRWEEPCLGGPEGAVGAVFFSHCNLRCHYCQNHLISQSGQGWPVTVNRLAEIFLERQEEGARCLELISPSHYSERVADALRLARGRGLSVPVAWNSNAYELPETLRRLSGLVDIFLPDLKYRDDRLAERYSGVPSYFARATAAISAMLELVGEPLLSDDGLLRRGVLIRHLVLPGQWRDSCRCLDWIREYCGDRVLVSLMGQYTPVFRSERHPEINRRLTTLEYQKVLRHAAAIGLRRGYRQRGGAAGPDFIPDFDGSGVIRPT